MNKHTAHTTLTYYTDEQHGEHTMTPKVRVTVELPLKDAEALQKLQRKHGWTRAEFIRAAMMLIQAQDAQIDSESRKRA